MWGDPPGLTEAGGVLQREVGEQPEGEGEGTFRQEKQVVPRPGGMTYTDGFQEPKAGLEECL